MGEHHESVAQRSAITRLAQRLEKAVELGMIPEGWHCQWCLQTAAAEIRRALDRPHEQTSDPFPRARGI
jgi:uncharacterized protein YeaC (DUF1315 family)